MTIKIIQGKGRYESQEIIMNWPSMLVQFSSVTQLCLTLCDPMNRSTPGLPVHHQLPESTQTHVHWVSDAIQPSHPLSSLSPPALNLSQHQGLFQWVSSSHQVAKVLELQLQHQSFQRKPWFPLGLIGLISLLSKRFSRVFSNTTVQKHQLFGAQLSLWFNCPIHTWLLEKPVCNAEIAFQKPVLQRLEIANIKHLEPGRSLPIAAILYYLYEDVTFQIVANVTLILYTASDN